MIFTAKYIFYKMGCYYLNLNTLPFLQTESSPNIKYTYMNIYIIHVTMLYTWTYINYIQRESTLMQHFLKKPSYIYNSIFLET